MGLFEPFWMVEHSPQKVGDAVRKVKQSNYSKKTYNKIAKNAPDATVRSHAVEKLVNQTSITYYAKNEPNSGVRCEAVKNLSNKALLAELALRTEIQMKECIADWNTNGGVNLCIA